MGFGAPTASSAEESGIDVLNWMKEGMKDLGYTYCLTLRVLAGGCEYRTCADVEKTNLYTWDNTHFLYSSLIIWVLFHVSFCGQTAV